MATLQGQFVWYELMTGDVAGAARFYGGVLGWSAADAGMPDVSYTIVSMGGIPVGGLMNLPARDARPGWMGYVAVDDVDETAGRVGPAGGTVHREPTDIPGVGRFAVLADPQGAVFIAFRAQTTGAPERPALGTPGHAGWHELQATDWERAFPFYAELFGWTKAEAVDMGPMGVYQLFAAGADPIGGMMTKPDAASPPAWRYYFGVEDIDAATRRVTQNGGQVASGPHPVPGGSWILHGVDPQGASFALVGPKH